MNIKNSLKRLLPDEIVLSRTFKGIMGYKLDLKNPQTYNEKLQWLKINDHNPLYTTMVDKYAAKVYVANLIGSEYIIPTLGVWNSFDEIDFSKLPNKFVLKTTHDSGSVVICRNKETFDIESARSVLEQSLKTNFYWRGGREWPYKHVPPRIIAEEYIDENGHTPEDYKILCFNGRPDNIMVCADRESGTTKFYFFDTDWKLRRLNGWGLKAPEGFTLPKPDNLDEMLGIAEKLSEGIPLLRVDLYDVNGHIYFGETTFYPDSGFDANITPECDAEFGKKLDLSKVKIRKRN